MWMMTNSESEEGTDTCDMPALPVFMDTTTMFYSAGSAEAQHVQLLGVKEVGNGQDRHLHIVTSCSLHQRFADGGTKQLGAGDGWTCKVSCSSTTCDVNLQGVPPSHGLFFQQVTAQRVGCQVPVHRVRTEDMAMREVHVPPQYDGTDTDRDGVVDALDECPQDGSKSNKGLCGCGVSENDSDGDGMPDCVDACPHNPNKTVVGQCGCNVDDKDTDHDGTPDCQDDCPIDPLKTVYGMCGCGTADTDSDGDHTPDCRDRCPSNATKQTPGVCGCNVLDVDVDGDGIMDCKDPCATPGGCLFFTSDLTANPAYAEPGDSIMLSVDVGQQSGQDITCMWSSPEGWSIEATASPCTTAHVIVPGATSVVRGSKGVVAVTATSSDGNEHQVTTLVGVASSWNKAPSTPTVSIKPTHPRAHQTLQCVVDKDSVDPEGDHVTYHFGWLRNGEETGIVGSIHVGIHRQQTCFLDKQSSDSTASGARGCVDHHGHANRWCWGRWSW